MPIPGIYPNFLGIGAHKCASTWGYRVLQEPPQAFVSQPKELEYFSKKSNQSETYYLDHFRGGKNAVVRGEVSTAYLHWPGTVQRVREFSRGTKIVLTLRDPICPRPAGCRGVCCVACSASSGTLGGRRWRARFVTGHTWR